jgi:hypothetical protein
LRHSELCQIIDAVKAVEEAKKRLDFPLRSGVTFFSQRDIWIFQAQADSKTCPSCNGAEDVSRWYGNHLRLFFPYLEIIDENTIYPHVHPNCRCRLVRYIGAPEA